MVNLLFTGIRKIQVEVLVEVKVKKEKKETINMSLVS